MLNVCLTIIVHLLKFSEVHKREIIKKNAVTVTCNVQLYRALGVIPVLGVLTGAPENHF